MSAVDIAASTRKNFDIVLITGTADDIFNPFW